MRTSATLWIFRVAAPVLAIGLAGAQVVSTHTASARSQEAFQQLWNDTPKLQVTLEMDRHEYFPREDAELTITVSNPGVAPLEVFAPFHPRTGRVELYFLDPGKSKTDIAAWHRVYYDESLGLDQDAPSTWLHPGQPAVVKYVGSDPAHSLMPSPQRGDSDSICSNCDIPEKEGTYQFRYEYGPEATVNFTVVWPQLEQWTQVWLEKHAQYKEPATGKALSLPRAVRFAVLEYQNNHIVVVSVNPQGGRHRKRTAAAS